MALELMRLKTYWFSLEPNGRLSLHVDTLFANNCDE